MKKTLLLILTLCLSLGQAPCLAYDGSDFEAYTQKRFSMWGIRNGAVLVSLHGERVATFVYGPANWRGGQVDENTCFRVASVTKFVTAVGLMTLYEQGLMPLDADVRTLLPFPVYNPAFEDIPITPRQILSHTSSLTNDLGNYNTIAWERLTSPYNEVYSLYNAPGSVYTYTNLGGALFGSLAESLSGMSLNSFMRQNVFDPLGIDAAYHPALLDDSSHVADNFAADGTIQSNAALEMERFSEYHDVCDPRGNCIYSVGRLYISAAGLERILITLLQGGTFDGVTLLQPETVALMEAEQNTLPSSSVTGRSPYGLGMEHLTGQVGGTWYGHQGRVGGFTCDAFYQKETGLTLVCIASGYSYRMKDGIAYPAIDFMEECQKLCAP